MKTPVPLALAIATTLTLVLVVCDAQNPTNEIGFIRSSPERLFSITNRPWLKMEGAMIIRVTDSEWALLTNAFPKNLQTNTITFFK